MYRFVFCMILTLTPLFSYSEETAVAPAKEIILTAPETTPLEKTKETFEKASDTVTASLNQTRNKRARSKTYILGSYSPADLLIPGKYGITFGRIKSAQKTWEFEYIKGSFSVPSVIEDLGKMEDKRYSLIQRNYFTNNSFNFSYGVTYFEFDIHLGDKYLNAMNANYPNSKYLELNALGFNLGLGNRWCFNNNFTIGIDWFSWSQPVFITQKHNAYSQNTNNTEYRDDVDTAMNILSYFPRVAAIKIQLGVTF